MPAQQDPAIDQLVRLLGEQQQIARQQADQIAQLLANNAVAVAPAAVQPQQVHDTIPSLPDVIPFECCDEKSRVTEWLERFQFALDCTAPNAKDLTKVKCLMNKLSEGAFSEYSRSVLPSVVTDFGFDDTIKKLQKLFSRPQSIFVDRYECLKAERGHGEDFRQFVNRHRKLLQEFKFDILNKEQFHCLMLLTALKSHNDSALRQRILAKLTADGDNVKYDNIVEDLQVYLSTIAEAKVIEQPTGTKNIFAVKKWHGRSKPPEKCHDQPRNSTDQSCWRCGKTHSPKSCPHSSVVCKKCNKSGHLEKMCEKHQAWVKRNLAKNAINRKQANSVRLGGLMINLVNQPKRLIEAPVSVDGNAIEFVMDPGAEITVLNKESHQLIGTRLSPCSEQAFYHDGSQCRLFGKGSATFSIGGRKTKGTFYVSDEGSLNLLGIDMLDALGLMDSFRTNLTDVLKLNNVQISEQDSTLEILKEKFSRLFADGLGRCTKAKARLELKHDAVPVYCRPRPVPYNTKLVVEAELDRLTELGVIRPVEHTRWAAPIVVVKKANGSTRVCADFSTGLNSALLLHQHPLPVPEDIFATLNGGQVFSQIDLKDAYLQIELDDNSKELCTIATHRGNFEYQRLPFGVKSAPGIFQSIMDSMLAGCNCAIAYLDDVIVVSRSADEHQQHLANVFQRMENFGFRIKPEKCSFFQSQIKYLGFIVDKDGRRPDPAKIQAIAEMPVPTNVSELRSFLGMINHYQQFVRNMRFIRQPMDELLKQDVAWNWSNECQQAFNKVIAILQSDKLLTHYDPAREIVVSADASEHGIGAVIAHRFPEGNLKAIAHASCSLTPAEKNYSQIEKEGLALIYAVKKFHKYLFGRHFTLQTDHKPLLAIFGNKKGIKACTANRLQRWAITLLGYDFNIEYKSTSEFGHADVLSRLIAKTPLPDDERIVASISTAGNLVLNAIEKGLPIVNEDLIRAADQDQTIQKVKKFVKTQWPNKKAISDELLPFHRRREALTIENDCLLFSDRVVVPASLQNEVLQLLHKGHPGIKRMKSLARQYVYWPGMDEQIENVVKSCQPCAAEAKAPVKTELHSWPKTDGPWKRIHMDYAGPFFGKMFLIIVDSFSKWPEVFEMRSSGTAATIEKLRGLCTTFGLPETLVTDNGTQFTSNEFKQFVTQNGITHLFSAPYNPMSNGQAERFVDTFKRTSRKLKGEGIASALETFLVTYRTTPSESLNGKTPAEMFLQRKVRTTLDLLMPKSKQPIVRDEAMEKNFNRRFGAKPRFFSVGDKVYARHRLSQQWKSGHVTTSKGVMYDVEFPNGSTSRFHANQLIKRDTNQMDIDPLTVFNEEFGLPNVAQQPGQHPIEAVVEPNIVVNAEPANDPPPAEQQQNSPNIPRRQYPKRNRRPPDRYSPK